MKVEQFFVTQVGTNNAYYRPIQDSLDLIKATFDSSHLDDVSQHLLALSGEIASGRLVLETAPKAVSDDTSTKFFDMVQVTVTLYQGIAASIIGFIILNNHFSHLHQNSLFWATIFAGVSFFLGVVVQANITESLARKKTLRESLLSAWSLWSMRGQIILLIASILCVGWYAFNGGHF